MTLSRCIKPASVLMLALATPSFSQSGFYGQDRNGDGVITRDEWRGSDQSFRQHDVNEDGVLSGNELPARMRTRRQTQEGRNNNKNRDYDRNRYNDQDRYNDRNRSDNQTSYGERNDGYRNRSAVSTGRNATIDQLDKNRNGVVEGDEWTFEPNLFHQLDRNGDSVLSADELRNTSPESLRNQGQNGNGTPNR